MEVFKNVYVEEIQNVSITQRLVSGNFEEILNVNRNISSTGD